MWLAFVLGCEGPTTTPGVDAGTPPTVSPGDTCQRESDCAELSGFACRPSIVEDVNGIPIKAESACLAENTGAFTAGTPCGNSADCHTGICYLGICSEICEADQDCATNSACESVTAYLDGTKLFSNGCPLAFSDAATLQLCLPQTALLETTLGTLAQGQAFIVDVPTGAASFMLIAETEREDVSVGFRFLAGPDWTDLYELPISQEELVAQAIRYVPDAAISSMLVPNTPDTALVPGPHCVEVFSTDIDVTPTVTVLTKMSPDGDVTAGRLSLNFYFMNLQSLGCGVDDLNAKTAPTHEVMDWVRVALADIFGATGIELGEINYFDRLDHPELDVIDATDTEASFALFALGEGDGYAVDVFLLRGIDGALGFAGGVPGPPGRHGIPHAGVVVSMESTCVLSLPNVIAHEVGHFLGLFHTVEQDGTPDNISDTDSSTDNVMSQSGYGNEFTSGQGFVMRRHANVELLP